MQKHKLINGFNKFAPTLTGTNLSTFIIYSTCVPDRNSLVLKDVGLGSKLTNQRVLMNSGSTHHRLKFNTQRKLWTLIDASNCTTLTQMYFTHYASCADYIRFTYVNCIFIQ